MGVGVNLIQRASDHVLHHAADRGVRSGISGNQFTVTQYGDAIREFEDFIKPMGNVENRDTLPAQAVELTEQSINFGFAQAGRWLIQDKQAGLAGERAGDGDFLLLCSAQSAESAMGRDVQLAPRETGSRFLMQTVPGYA